jgi:hypothetical protein
MKLTILAAALACFTSAPSLAAEPPPGKASGPETRRDYPAGIIFEFTLLEGARTIASATLHADLNSHQSAQGSVLLRHANGDRWRIDGNLSHWHDPAKGDAAPLEGSLQVEISDLRLAHVPQGTSNSIFTPTIYEIHRIYRGPGIYQLFEEGDRRMLVTVKDSIAVGEKRVDPRPAPSKR